MTTNNEFLPAASRTLPRMLMRQASHFGDHPAVTFGSKRWKHRDLPEIASRSAGTLNASTIERGDHVAIMSSNRSEFMEIFLGCGWIGAVLVPINTASKAPQIEYFLRNSQAKVLAIEAKYFHELVQVDLAETYVQKVCVLDNPDTARLTLETMAVETRDGYGPEIPAADIRPGDTLAILYTSGTTGPSKGVLCPHAQYYWWGRNSAHILGINREDVLCTTLPLFHINALNTFAQSCLTGSQVVFGTRFSASGFWASMRECEATVIYLLGAMVPILLSQPEGVSEHNHSIRIGLGPGVPEQALKEFLARTGVQLVDGYASTETNFVIAGKSGFPRYGAMGWELPGYEIRVADEDDAEVRAGQAGELLLRAAAPYAFSSGYFNMPEKTTKAWRNLWFHTGDRVVREADGALRFIDRIKDSIRRRGENISSFEVEQALLSHPEVAVAAAFPVRSELAEDEVMAAVVAKPGLSPAAEDIATWCEARLPYFAVPRYIDIVDTLPRTENGKIQKYRLQQRGVSTATWERPQQSGSTKT